jgi:hypothetical protein
MASMNMKSLAGINPIYLAAGALILGAVWWVKKSGAAGVGQSIGSAAADLTNGVISGGVTGIGAAVGIPKTNLTQCQKDKAAGDTWAASFSCTALDFLKYAL